MKIEFYLKEKNAMRSLCVKHAALLFVLLSIVVFSVTACTGAGIAPVASPLAPVSTVPTPRPTFSGEEAYKHVIAQTDFGARPTGSEAGWKTGDYIIVQLKRSGWQVEAQEFEYQGVKARNIIGKRGSGPIVIVGAHYDTRRQADNDPDPVKRVEPVMGANDGASGVAVLLEMAQTLDVAQTQREIWLTFFDAEDNGSLAGWDWIVGSTYLAQQLTVTPTAMILLDMIGDADQQLYWDHNSNPQLNESIWQTASELGFAQQFIPQYKWTMIDDHVPFAQRGIPAIDLIDFDYPYWHTTQDTADKVSPRSLERMGRTMNTWLEQTPP
ncbi:Aminopeptidase YwaD [Thermoflexales bacterium]|nr:Aminopeptidase YwaD [Thermoflexales bacterium]